MEEHSNGRRHTKSVVGNERDSDSQPIGEVVDCISQQRDYSKRLETNLLFIFIIFLLQMVTLQKLMSQFLD